MGFWNRKKEEDADWDITEDDVKEIEKDIKDNLETANGTNNNFIKVNEHDKDKKMHGM